MMKRRSNNHDDDSNAGSDDGSDDDRGSGLLSFQRRKSGLRGWGWLRAPVSRHKALLYLAVLVAVALSVSRHVQLLGVARKSGDTATLGGRHGGEQQPLLVRKEDVVYSHEYRTPIVIEEYKLIFFAIPKVACTAWKLLFHRMIGQGEWLVTRQRDVDGRKGGYHLHDPSKNKLRHLSDYNLTRASQIMQDPTWTKAVFVRNPHERLLSAYLDKGPRVNFTVIQNKCCPLKKKKGHEKMNVETTGCMDEDGKRNLDDFFRFMSASPRRACRENLHWLPQSDFFDGTKYYPFVNFVGHFDSLADDAERLLKRIGAWEEHGKTGWGPNGTSPIFDRDNKDGRWHATAHVASPEASSAAGTAVSSSEGERKLDKLRKYYRNQAFFDEVTQFYEEDYRNPIFNLQVPVTGGELIS